MSTQEFYDPFCILLKANSNLDVLDQASYISCRNEAWFPYDRPDHPDRDSRFETIGSFDMIVSIASKAKDAGSSAMSLGETIEFITCFENKPNMMIFFRRANLVPCYLLFLSILRGREASRVPRRHSIIFLNIFLLFFPTLAPSRPNLFSITGI